MLVNEAVSSSRREKATESFTFFNPSAKAAPLNREYTGFTSLIIRVCTKPAFISFTNCVTSLLFPPRTYLGCAGLKRSEEHTSELQSRPHLVCRLLLEKKKH